MSELLTGAVFVGNDEDLSTREKLVAHAPATGDALAPVFASADDGHVNRAADLAWEAFDRYRKLDLMRRAEFLEAIAAEILALGDTLIERAMLETGLLEARLRTERTRTCNQLILFAETIRRGDWLDLRVDTALPDRKPAPRAELRLRQVPLGPVAVFGSSNFPLAFSVAGGDTASALAAGCPVIVKGHPLHLGTGELVARAVLAAANHTGMPEGVFSYLPGGIETGVALVQHPRIKAVGFTGSRAGGLALVNLAASRPEPIPVYAEMSSVNPVFVLPAALKNRAAAIATGYVASLTLGAGQFCTNPGLMFVIDAPELDALRKALGTELAEHRPATMLSPSIQANYERGRSTFDTHRAVTALARSQAPIGLSCAASVVFATDLESFLEDQQLAHEVFGASSLIIICKDVSGFKRAAEHLEGQLTATLQMQDDDLALAQDLVPILERKAGRLVVNDWPTGVEVADAMVHGGPFPATSSVITTSVGTLAIRRFLRPVSYQSFPAALLPAELRSEHVTSLPHLLNGKLSLPSDHPMPVADPVPVSDAPGG